MYILKTIQYVITDPVAVWHNCFESLSLPQKECSGTQYLWKSQKMTKRLLITRFQMFLVEAVKPIYQRPPSHPSITSNLIKHCLSFTSALCVIYSFTTVMNYFLHKAQPKANKWFYYLNIYHYSHLNFNQKRNLTIWWFQIIFSCGVICH